MNGNMLDNTQIKYGEKLTIFGTCDDCVNAETLYKNLMGTSYTGGDNPRTYNDKDSYQYLPKNLSEYGSIRHDKKYDKKGVSGLSGALLNPNVKNADMELAMYNALNMALNTNISEKLKSGATSAAFLFIATYKNIISQMAAGDVGTGFPQNKK